MINCSCDTLVTVAGWSTLPLTYSTEVVIGK